MTNGTMRVEVQGADISRDARHLLQDEDTESKKRLGDCVGSWTDDPGATITLSEFRALAWAAANAKRRASLGGSLRRYERSRHVEP